MGRLKFSATTQVDLIPVRRPDLALINKIKEKKQGTCRILGLPVPADHRWKIKKSEIRNRWIKKVMLTSTVISAWNGPQCFGKWFERFVNCLTNQDHSNYSVAETDQSTEKGSGDLRRIAVTQTPVKDHKGKVA